MKRHVHIGLAAALAISTLSGCSGSLETTTAVTASEQEQTAGTTQAAVETKPEESAKDTINTATLTNFISGLWEAAGDNGMPTPERAAISRPINVGIDTDGNAIEAIDEQDVRYFDGKYYLYGQSFAYGTFHYAPGTRQYAVTPTTPNSFYRYGGTAVYSSDDLMNWEYESTMFFEDENGVIVTAKKPRVVYSEATGLYVMWFCGEPPYGISGIPAPSQLFKIAVSESPTGPFKLIGRPQIAQDPTGNAIGADYEIVVAPDGTGYLVNSHNGVSVSRLNPEMTGIEETLVVPLVSDTIAGGIGIHYHDDWWYITGSSGCGNCVSSPFWYIMARDPMGPWLSPETMSDETPLQPVKLLDNVESAQVHSSKMFPDSEGRMNVLIPATHYRRDLGAPDASGDNNFAHTGHFYFTLQYDEEGRILPPELNDTEEIPLAHEVSASIPPAYEAQLNITSTDIFEHTDPAEVTDNIRMVEQSWELAEGETLAAIMPAVFQKTPDYSAEGTARADAVVAPQDTFVNAPLLAKLELPDGSNCEWVITPETVRWAPTQVALNLPKAYTGGGRVTLTLSTEGTNGGYGVAVGFKEKNERYRLNQGAYRTYNEKEGGWIDRPEAEMLVRTSSKALSAPVITVQPHSISSVENGLASFWVQAKGVGVGYRWLKDGKPIYSEYSAQSGLGSEATAPSFRLQDLTKDDEGVYTVEVFNQVGSVVSDPVTLEVADAYAVSGTVSIPDWTFYNNEKEAIVNYNTVVQLYRVTDGVMDDTPIAETLVRGDGRYCFEVGYRGDTTNVDDFVSRRFQPGTYAVVVTTRDRDANISATEYVEIKDRDVTVDLSMAGLSTQMARAASPVIYEQEDCGC